MDNKKSTPGFGATPQSGELPMGDYRDVDAKRGALKKKSTLQQWGAEMDEWGLDAVGDFFRFLDEFV